MAVPVCDGSIASSSQLDGLHERILVAMVFAHVVAIDHVNGGVLGGLKQQVLVGTGLIRQKRRTTGADIGVGIADAILIVWSEIVAYGESGPVEFEKESP